MHICILNPSLTPVFPTTPRNPIHSFSSLYCYQLIRVVQRLLDIPNQSSNNFNSSSLRIQMKRGKRPKWTIQRINRNLKAKAFPTNKKITPDQLNRNNPKSITKKKKKKIRLLGFKGVYPKLKDPSGKRRKEEKIQNTRTQKDGIERNLLSRRRHCFLSFFFSFWRLKSKIPNLRDWRTPYAICSSLYILSLK